jgi:hypothetical protein
MYHHIIHGLCEHVLAVKGKEKIVIVYSESISPARDLYKFDVNNELSIFMNKFISKINKMLPIKFLITDHTFNSIRKSMKLNTGDYIEVLNSAKTVINEFDTGKYTFSKTRYFAKKYGLEFLSNNYFQQILKKQLILM